ncbi:hypothetical protein NQ317_014000, partial [Molorchus minor]
MISATERNFPLACTAAMADPMVPPVIEITIFIIRDICGRKFCFYLCSRTAKSETNKNFANKPNAKKYFKLQGIFAEVVSEEYSFYLSIPEPLNLVFKSTAQTAHNIHWTSILHPKLVRTSMDLSKGSFQEAALIIFPSTPIKNTKDGMKRWLRRAKERVNRTYESKEQQKEHY